MGTVYIFLLFAGIWIVMNSCLRLRSSDRELEKDFAKQNFPFKGNVFRTPKGTELHYIESGREDKPLLIFFHGTPGSCHDFKAYFKEPSLQAQFHLMAIDRPGFGYSQFGKALNLEEQYQAYEALFDSLHINKKVYLLGHSLGGPIIAGLAVRRPQAYNGLFMLAGSLSPALEPKEKWRYLFTQSPSIYLLPGAFRPSNTELVYFKKDIVSLSKVLDQITIPVWVHHALNDALVPYENALYMKEAMKNAPVELFPYQKGNHFLQFNQVDSISRQIVSTQML